MAHKNPAERAADRLGQRVDPKIDRLARDIVRRLGAGGDVDAAVDAAVQREGLAPFLKDEITKSVERLISDITGGVKDGPGLRRWWLNKVWPGDDMSLSARVNDVTRMDDIKENIRDSMRQAKSWHDTALALADNDLTKADLAGHIDTLTNSARRVMQGDTEAVREYQAALRASMRQVDRLAQDGAPTERLKAAYQAVINTTQKTSESAMNEAMDRLIREKMRYNADRISRTETAKAYAQATYGEALADEDVIGMGYDLSDRHPKADICNFHTGADLFGLGAGRYPLEALPEYPFHPQCMCTSYSVYSGDARGMDPRKARSFLAGQSAEDRRAMLGVQGEREFRQDPGTWEQNLRNYNGHKDIQQLYILPSDAV